MASAQNSVQNSQTRTVQHNHVIIQYQQPPDPAIVNHVLEILVAIMGEPSLSLPGFSTKLYE